jgi:hypothetical protein
MQDPLTPEHILALKPEPTEPSTNTQNDDATRKYAEWSELRDSTVEIIESFKTAPSSAQQLNIEYNFTKIEELVHDIDKSFIILAQNDPDAILFDEILQFLTKNIVFFDSFGESCRNGHGQNGQNEQNHRQHLVHRQSSPATTRAHPNLLSPDHGKAILQRTDTKRLLERRKSSTSINFGPEHNLSRTLEPVTTLEVELVSRNGDSEQNTQRARITRSARNSVVSRNPKNSSISVQNIDFSEKIEDIFKTAVELNIFSIVDEQVLTSFCIELINSKIEQFQTFLQTQVFSDEVLSQKIYVNQVLEAILEAIGSEQIRSNENLGRSHVWQWRDDGQLTGHFIGHIRFILEKAVFIDNQGLLALAKLSNKQQIIVDLLMSFDGFSSFLRVMVPSKELLISEKCHILNHILSFTSVETMEKSDFNRLKRVLTSLPYLMHAFFNSINQTIGHHTQLSQEDQLNIDKLLTQKLEFLKQAILNKEISSKNEISFKIIDMISRGVNDFAMGKFEILEKLFQLINAWVSFVNENGKLKNEDIEGVVKIVRFLHRNNDLGLVCNSTLELLLDVSLENANCCSGVSGKRGSRGNIPENISVNIPGNANLHPKKEIIRDIQIETVKNSQNSSSGSTMMSSPRNNLGAV